VEQCAQALLKFNEKSRAVFLHAWDKKSELRIQNNINLEAPPSAGFNEGYRST